MKYFDPLTVSVIFGGLVVLVVAVVLRQVESMQKAVPVWLAAGLVGLLLGSGGTLAAVHVFDFSQGQTTLLSESLKDDPAATKRQSTAPGMPTGMPAGAMGGGMGGGGGGMGGGMMGGGMGGGGMGGGAPPARRTLPATIGKLDLVLRGLTLSLDSERKAKLAEAIKELDEPAEMTNDEAKGHLDAINALLTDDEKDLLASFSLPFGRPSGGSGGAGGMAGGPGGMGGGGPSGGGGGMGGGGGGQASNENPFKQDENARRLKDLRERIGAPTGDSKPEA